IELVTY
ncbi:hypothetical protein VCHC17A2_0489B, partial [Vibrio cholerae HC-17A2]